jgi:hypothetical protein
MKTLCLLNLAIVAGFPDRALDLLLTLGPQVFPEASPVENREPTPEVAFDPVLRPLNVSFAYRAYIHRVSPFLRPLAEGQGVPVFFHPAPFLGRNRLTQTRTVARNSDPPAAQPASVTERNGPQGWRACGEATAHNIKRSEAGTAGVPAPCGDLVTPRRP